LNTTEQQNSNHERNLFERYRDDEEWRTKGFRDDRSSAFAESSEFGRTVLKQLFLLNGSGLIAIAPLLQLGGADVAAHKTGFLALSIFLVAGLVFAILATLSGFFSATKYGDASTEMVTNQVLVAEYHAFTRSGRNQDAQLAKGREQKAKDRADKDYSDAGWYRNAAVITGLMSLFFFLLGVCMSIKLVGI
jgi:hypothetical protein